jgi:hypothetical protein
MTEDKSKDLANSNNDSEHVDDVGPENELDCDTLLALELFKNPTNVGKAGLIAGFSKGYVNTGEFYRKVKSAKFQKLLKEISIAHDFKHLALVYGLEEKALESAMEQAETDKKTAIGNVAKLARTVKQKKQITQIFQDPQSPVRPTISIESIKVFWKQALSNDAHEPEAVEKAEVIQNDDHTG